MPEIPNNVEPQQNSRYKDHLVRLYAGDFKRLGKFYRKPTRAIRELVRAYLNRLEKE